MTGFQGKSVLVTGATSGIGEAIAMRFASLGARLLLTGRRTLSPADLAARFPSPDGEVRYLAADLTEPDAADRLVAEAVTLFGGLDVLVNNAGILFRGTTLECTDEQWDATLLTNVTAAFRLSRAALRVMTAKKSGSIVNIASDWGLVGARGAAAYGASKGALVQLTRSMALDHAADGVRINAVCPGDTDTRMLDGAMSGVPRAQLLNQLGEAIPLGRVGRPSEVADAVCFLASSQSSFITGAMLAVDGGNSAG
jgi:meso-butanediol dehydrogenase / (S,S)-butanediol dehydrogenase / diacetyl reductase